VKPPASFSTLGSEFDDFLFAAIGEATNGMPLSVVSALARMDLDPWHEAASLAAMSVETATGKLTSLLAALPDPALKRLEPGITAARLIALLQRPDPDARSSAAAVATAGDNSPSGSHAGDPRCDLHHPAAGRSVRPHQPASTDPRRYRAPLGRSRRRVSPATGIFRQMSWTGCGSYVRSRTDICSKRAHTPDPDGRAAQSPAPTLTTRENQHECPTAT
jgi:hypothetical protein